MQQGKVSDSLRSTEPITLEVEYSLSSAVTGLRVGVYLLSTRGELVFTSFDTDEGELYEKYPTRAAGHYISSCTIPADLLNEGRFVLGMNASSFQGEALLPGRASSDIFGGCCRSAWNAMAGTSPWTNPTDELTGKSNELKNERDQEKRHQGYS